MPRAARTTQNTGQYRSTPFTTSSSERQQQRIRHQAQQAARQQQQEQDFLSSTAPITMQSLHMNASSQHMSYSTNAMPSMYMPLPPTTQSYAAPYANLTTTSLTSNLSPSNIPPPVLPPTSTRPSSGAWSPSEDSTLMSARSSGQNWSQIQSLYFPSKTANACRKRHERLMDKRNIDDWDAVKLEQLGREYMAMRREIWSGLAERCGEKWAVVEAKVLGSGYKNLQSAARASHRRARLTAGGNANGSVDLTANGSSYTDDSALGDEEYGDSNSNSDCYEYGDNYPQTSQIHSQDGKVAHSRQGSRSYTQQGMMMGVGGATNGLNGMTANGYGYAMQGGGHMMRGQAGLGNGRDMGIGSIINGASGGV